MGRDERSPPHRDDAPYRSAEPEEQPSEALVDLERKAAAALIRRRHDREEEKAEQQRQWERNRERAKERAASEQRDRQLAENQRRRNHLLDAVVPSYGIWVFMSAITLAGPLLMLGGLSLLGDGQNAPFFLGSGLLLTAVLGTVWAGFRLVARRRVARLGRLPFTLEGYREALSARLMSCQLALELQFENPPGPPPKMLEGLLYAARVKGTVGSRGITSQVLRCQKDSDDPVNNRPLYRWLTAVLDTVLLPVHDATPLSAVRVVFVAREDVNDDESSD